MVCEPSLAFCARQIELGSYLLLGKGEEATGGRNRDSIVSDAMEATIGAIFLDGGFTNAKEFILNYVLNDIEHKQLFYDSKTILQEIIQAQTEEAMSYEVLKEEGPDHDKNFCVAVRVRSETRSSAREAGEQKKRRNRRRRIMRSSAAGRNRERQPLCSMCIPRTNYCTIQTAWR